jgi:ferredoxin
VHTPPGGASRVMSRESRRRGAVKVRVDPDLCVGHGRCYVLAPDVFAPDDFGHCEIVVSVVDGALAEQARIGAENCPERAISLED